MLSNQAQRFLIRNYGKLPIENIAKELQVSKRTVSSTAKALGLTKSNIWTDEELALLHELAETMPFKALTVAYRMRASKRRLKPHRTNTAIKIQLHRLGYSTNPQINYFSCSQIAGALGIHRSTVGNWIRSQKLKGTRCAGKQSQYFIKREDLYEFVVRCRDDIVFLDLDSEAWRWLLVQFEKN